MTIELQLFGGFAAKADGQAISGLRAAAPARLFAYLALNRETGARRAFLAGLFWPDGSDLRARRRLSHTLWVLQTALAEVAPSLIQADRDTIGLDPDAEVWIDTAEFERQIDQFDVRRREGTAHLHADSLAYTIDLYRGDLLSDHYDDWVEPARLRLREKYLVGLENLVQLQKSSRDYRCALVSARRMVAETPLSERSHLELMRLYWLVGRADEAIAQHQVCKRMLREDLGVEPSQDLNALKDRILQQRVPVTDAAVSPTTPAGADDPGLVGRFEARGRLLDVVDAALGGAGGFALIEGQTGMGKTRLLTDVAEAARWRDASVLWARHGDQEEHEPYGAILRALSAELNGLRREQVLARLDPEFLPLATQLLPTLGDGATPIDGGRWSSPDERCRLHEALTQILLAFAAVTPTTLIIDDLQWADDATLEFLRLAGPRIVKSKIAVGLSYRTQEARNRPSVWQLLTDVEQRHRVTRVPLNGFSRDEITALSQSRGSHVISDELIDRLERATGGNPLFVIETLRAMEPVGATDPDPDVIDDQLGGRATVQRVMQILLHEIDNSPVEVQAVVGALAVWGGATTTAVITRLSGLETTVALDAIRHAMDSDFVSEVDGDYMLRFEQLASAARTGLSREDKRNLHHRAGDLLTEDPGAPASELAGHYRNAERWVDAARYETAAAARASSLHSYGTAAHYYELAVKSLENAGETPSAGFLFGFEAVLDVLGRCDDRARIIESFDPSALSVAQQARLLQREALFLTNTDQLLDGIRTASAALSFALATRIDWTPPAVALARVFIIAGRPSMAAAHLRGVEAEGTSAVSLASAQLALGQAMTDIQDFHEADELLGSALEIYRREGDSRGQVDALASMGILQSQHGNPATAERNYRDAIALARQIGSRFGEGMALANLALLTYMQGNAATALDHMREAAEVFMAIDHRRGEAMVRANSASIWHAILGDDGRAEREATAARRYFAEIGDSRHEAQCLDVLSGIRRRKRAYAVSRPLAETALKSVRTTGDRWLEAQMLRSLARTEHEAGRPAEAHHAVAEAIALCREIELDAELPVLLVLQGVVLNSAGRTEEAIASASASASMPSSGAELSHLAAWWRHEVFAAANLTECAEADLLLAHRLLSTMLEPFDEADRNSALSRVGEHRSITEAYARRFPRTEVVELSEASNPTGDSRVQVEWTVHHPDDFCVNDKKDRRKRRLVRIIGEADLVGARARIEDLAAALDTSASTLKRDLSALRADGLIH
jgi:DNA-binding SARP family transcriptional activator/tetratricopeptide (TPR) repeat protein